VATPTRPHSSPLDDARFNVTGTSFADPAVERSFARRRFERSSRSLAVVAGFCAGAWLLLAPTDWTGGASTANLLAATARLVATCLLTVASVGFWTRAEWLCGPQGRRLLTSATATLTGSFLLVVAIRGTDPAHLDVSAALFGTAILLFVPIPLGRRVGIVTAFYAAFWLVAVLEWDTTPGRLAANLVVATLGGIACAAHMERGARREYLLIDQLQRSNGNLSDQVDRHVSVERALTRLASEDELTGLLNRRAFFATVGDAVDREGRSGVAGAAILVDADRFKSINDDHGHDVGDRVLQGIALTLAHAVRTGDLVARIGGEEFAVYLPGARLPEARIVAERIRAAVAECAWTVARGSVTVTVSVGVAERSDGEAVSEVLRRADNAMYRSKRAGGDRLVCDSSR
jgi:diguanylate cyclase (GGDEF)-like protein